MVAKTTSEAYFILKINPKSPLLEYMSPIAPVNPIITPAMLNIVPFILKKESPNNSVNNGVNEFSIPASELLIPVCAMENINAGMKFPIIPEIIRKLRSLAFTFFNLRKANGVKNRKVIVILIIPTSTALKKSSDLFMSINELPQIRASEIRINHCIRISFFKIFSCLILRKTMKY